MKLFAPKAMKHILVCLMLIILTTDCTNRAKKQLPTSIGQPYEVVLEGDTDHIISQILTDDVPGLPQSEPLCNVISVKQEKAKGSYSIMRTRIVVDINKQNKGFFVKIYKDKNASPQTVICLKAKSTEQLRATFYDKNGAPNKNGEFLRTIIDKNELQHLASTTKINPEKQREIKDMFGIDMTIPLSLNASKKETEFLWLSNNASSGMQNLIFFRLKENGSKPYEAQTRLDWNYILKEANNVLKKHMPGETELMYMQLIKGQKNIHDENHNHDYPNAPYTLWTKGLWEMKGDAMGGPYILKCIPMSQGKPITRFDTRSRRIDSQIIVIGFVYAPEMKKRNLIKQLEAVLTTIR